MLAGLLLDRWLGMSAAAELRCPLVPVPSVFGVDAVFLAVVAGDVACLWVEVVACDGADNHPAHVTISFSWQLVMAVHFRHALILREMQVLAGFCCLCFLFSMRRPLENAPPCRLDTVILLVGGGTRNRSRSRGRHGVEV